MRIHFVRQSSNVKTGPIPVTYSERSTCPQSCPHYGTSCYADAGFHTRMTWDKVSHRGGSIDDLCARIESMPDGQLWRMNVAGDLPGVGERVNARELARIVNANKGKRGYTYTHKRQPQALEQAKKATANGFVVNVSADTLAEADNLANAGAWPIAALVPSDAPEKLSTPSGRKVIVCPAQTRDNVTCASCGLCAVASRKVIIGFRAHGAKAKQANIIAKS